MASPITNGNAAHHGNEVGLFGGAFKCLLPKNIQDMSKFREIPDNQEVFCHESCDQSVMFDILEYQDQVQGENAVRYHFNDLADCNEANGEIQVENIEKIPTERIKLDRCTEAWCLCGSQQVSKFNEGITAQNVLRIFMVLFRLPTFTTDIIVVMNDPVTISEASSSSKTIPTSRDAWTVESFREMACTLRLVDSTIFAS